MRRHLALAVAATTALAVLVGCRDDASETGSSTASAPASTTSATPSEEPAESSSAPTSPSPSKRSPSPKASPTTDGPAQEPDLPEDRTMARNLHTAVLGTSVARTAEEKAVVEAWMDFWQGAADTYYLYKPTAQFNRVARGEARAEVLTYTAKLKARKQRVVGWARDNVTSIEVDGNDATVRDCTKNFTFRVDVEAEPLTRPMPYYDVTGTLRKTDGRWTVVAQKTESLDKSCL